MKNFTLILFCVPIFTFCQVGINTLTPTATLEIQNPTLIAATKTATIKSNLPSSKEIQSINPSSTDHYLLYSDNSGNLYKFKESGYNVSYFSNKIENISTTFVNVAELSTLTEIDFITSKSFGNTTNLSLVFGKLLIVNKNPTFTIKAAQFISQPTLSTLIGNNTSLLQFDLTSQPIDLEFRINSNMLQVRKTSTSGGNATLYIEGIKRI